MPLNLGADASIKYNGLLAQKGAQQIWMHYGYGDAHGWKGVTDMPLNKSPEGWEGSLHIDNPSRLNFCFKDDADNWDNNQGNNWSLKVHTGS